MNEHLPLDPLVINKIVNTAMWKHHELTSVDLRVYHSRLSMPDALQDDIALAVNVTIRQVRRAEKKLEELGLIQIERTRHRGRGKTINRYRFPDLD